MSHFTVLVIGDAPERQLAPYQENNNDDCPKEYLTFFDAEDEGRQKYATASVNMVVMPDGRLLLPWDEAFRTQGTFGFGGDTHAVSAELERRDVPMTERYATFEAYMEDWEGFRQRDPETGRYGYWENPNRKWDWYQLGGRWTGFFRIKPEVMAAGAFERIAVGEPGLGADQAARGNADQALKGQIDFDAMRDEAAGAAIGTYARFEEAIKGQPPAKSFAEIREDLGDDEESRKVYWGQPLIKALSAAGLLPFNGDYRDFYCLDSGGRDAFVARARTQAVCTHAVLKDGVWYERGEMGWWGVVSDAKSADEWLSEVAKLLESLPDDTLLSVYDCHI